jgi:hypothetical protein
MNRPTRRRCWTHGLKAVAPPGSKALPQYARRGVLTLLAGAAPGNGLFTVCLMTTMQIERTPLNFSRRDSSRRQLSASCTLQPPLSLTRRGQSRLGNRSPQDRDRCGARLVRARQAGWGTWPGDFERPRHRPRCVRRPPQPRSLRRGKLPQRFSYSPAHQSGTGAMLRHGPARQERATMADFRPQAPLRHSALPQLICQPGPACRFGLTRRSG